MSNEVKDLDIKNDAYYLFDDMMHTEQAVDVEFVTR